MQISEVTAFLEHAFDVLNYEYFDNSLPAVKITIQSTPKSLGHYTTINAWHDTMGVGYREINIAAEALSIPIEELMAVLVHEMVHHYCACNGIKDTSRGNVWHNKRFKEEAEKRGLIIHASKKTGFSPTEPAPDLVELVCRMGWREINLARVNFESLGGSGGSGSSSGGSGEEDGEEPKKKKSHIRKYQCPVCGCSVRASKEVSILCLDCNRKMLLATPPDELDNSEN